MEGSRVGYALESFNSRYAELSVDLNGLLGDIRWKKQVDDYHLSGIWTATNDARSYTVLGDPAVRLPLAADASLEKHAVLGQAAIPRIVSSSPKPAALPDSAVQSATSPGTAAASFGFLDDTRSTLQSALQKLTDVLASAFDSLTKVEVATYTSERLEDVTYADGKFTGARLRGLTRASLDGNTLVCVPEQDGKVDDALWAIHAAIVDRALRHRVEMLQLAASAASSLIGAKQP